MNYDEMAAAWRDASEHVEYLAREDAPLLGMGDERWLAGYDRQRRRQLESLWEEALFPSLSEALGEDWSKFMTGYGTARYRARGRYFWRVSERYDVFQVAKPEDYHSVWRVEDKETGLLRDFETKDLLSMVETILRCAESCNPLTRP